MNFGFDIDKYASWMLPTFLRKAKMKAFVKVLLTPMQKMWVDSNLFYQSIIAGLQPYCLTDVLQAKLRLLYPMVGGFQCYVKNQDELTQQVWLQYIGEHQLQENDYSIGESFTQEYDYNIEEQTPINDYIIIVPLAYNTVANNQQLNFFLNKYKVAGRVYQLSFQNII
jgi:hypothetical protein